MDWIVRLLRRMGFSVRSPSSPEKWLLERFISMGYEPLFLSDAPVDIVAVRLYDRGLHLMLFRIFEGDYQPADDLKVFMDSLFAALNDISIVPEGISALARIVSSGYILLDDDGHLKEASLMEFRASEKISPYAHSFVRGLRRLHALEKCGRD